MDERVALPPKLKHARVHTGERKTGKLNPLKVKALVRAGVAGRWGDGAGLCLVSKTGRTFWWEFVYRRDGRAHSIALGNLLDVSLAESRGKAEAHRAALRQGKEPERSKKPAQSATARTVRACIDEYIKLNGARWSLSSQRQWAARRISTPGFLQRPVAEITALDIIDVLRPRTAPMRARIVKKLEAVFDWVIARGFRDPPNPASLKIGNYLTQPKHKTIHHPAMPWQVIPEFMQELRARDDLAARCLEFQILCTVRPSEARGASWAEIDVDNATWVIPAERAKMRREFRVPLSSQAVALLRRLQETCTSALIFPSTTEGVMAPMTIAERIPKNRFLATEGEGPHAHGFRSSFADWSAHHKLSFEATEKCLAHHFGDATVRSYRRSDLFDARRVLLQQWANFLG